MKDNGNISMGTEPDYGMHFTDERRGRQTIKIISYSGVDQVNPNMIGDCKSSIRSTKKKPPKSSTFQSLTNLRHSDPDIIIKPFEKPSAIEKRAISLPGDLQVIPRRSRGLFWFIPRKRATKRNCKRTRFDDNPTYSASDDIALRWASMLDILSESEYSGHTEKEDEEELLIGLQFVE
jgi:hypothetical protein